MAVFALHVAASRRLPGDHYTDEQVRDWADKRGDGPERYDTDDLVVAERVAQNEGPRTIRSGGFREKNGDVVGFGEWGHGDDDDDETGVVVACYVHPDHARTGVGTVLLERLHDELREAGYDRAELTSSLNAVAFYERHGYEEVERFTIQPRDVEFSVVRMANDL